MEHRQTDALIIAALAVFGLLLRVAAAGGDLWLDEIYTLVLLEEADTPLAVFTSVLHDNNHHLNSLYLYFAGDVSSVRVLRALSIALGLASVPVAAWALRPYGRSAMLIAAGLVALSYPMVHYGSEARGYAGLLLCILLAFGFAGRNLASVDPRTHRLALAAAIAAGTLFHLTMLFTALCIGLWVLWERWQRTGWQARRAIVEAQSFLMPAVLAGLSTLLLLFLPLFLGSATSISMGGVTPFSWEGFARGYGNILRLTVGFRKLGPDGIFLILVLFAVVLSRRFLAPRYRPLHSLTLISMVLVPLVMALSGLPNLNMGRYFLFAAVVLVFWLAVVCSQFAASGRPGRTGATLLLVTLCGFSLWQTANLVSLRRGQYTAALETMAASGPARVGVSHSRRIEVIAGFFRDRRKALRALTLVGPEERRCDDPTDWYVVEVRSHRPPHPRRIQAGPSTCKRTYELVKIFPAFGLSGQDWAIYARQPGPPAVADQTVPRSRSSAMSPGL